MELVRAGYFPGRNQTLKLLAATKSLVAFAKANKYTLARKTITKKSLNWVSGEYPELKTKGYDTFVIGSWLASLVEARDCGIPDLSTALWASNNVLTLLAEVEGLVPHPTRIPPVGSGDLHLLKVALLGASFFLNLSVVPVSGNPKQI